MNSSSPPGYVRPFQSADRQRLLTIGSETAFFGEPIERFLDDRRAFEDAFFAYYTDFEPEHAWVAVLPDADGKEKVAGFLTGCINARHRDQILRKKIVPQVLKKALSGYYRVGPKTWRYIGHGLQALLRGEIPQANLAPYPAHLHINLLPEARGQGLGYALIQAYLCQLRELKIPGVHLETTSMNKAAVSLYERVGFHLLASRPTQIWSHLIHEPVENRIYGMILALSE